MYKSEVYSWLKNSLLDSEPSKHFKNIENLNLLKEWFPELLKLKEIDQNPKFHPEGSVWNHTMLVIDQAALIKNQSTNSLYFMITALVHDYGKATTTTVEEDGRIRSIGHEFETNLIIHSLKRLTDDRELFRYVENMVKLHMRPNPLVYVGAKDRAYNKLFQQALYPKDLLLLAKADHKGRASYSDYDEVENKLQQELLRFMNM